MEEKDIFFDVDFIIKSINFNTASAMTKYLLHQDFIEEILKKCRELKSNKIITNGNIASVITDSKNYTFVSLVINNINKNYSVGQIDGVKIFIDPYIRWDDNYIHFENDNEQLIRKMKIKTIQGSLSDEEKKIKFGRIYSGYVRDTQGVLL